MKDFLAVTREAIASTLILALVCCGLYPLVVFGIAQVAFNDRANGSLIVDSDGTVRGSRLLGQGFTGERYFHPRPSAAGAGYDAASSSGSNLGPTSEKLVNALKERIAAYRLENGLQNDEAVPADAVTSSASGLDPHISVANAGIQVARVARTRGVRPEAIRQLVLAHTAPGWLGVLGDAGVNVLQLNLALDSMK